MLVHIHGGGYIAGSPASPWYDGAAFNRSLSGLPTDIPLDAARRTTAEVAARLGVSADRAGFAAVPERDLIEAQNFDAVQSPEPSVDELVALMRTMDGTLPLGPVVDGHLHQWTVEEGLRSGQGRDIPLLVGSTRQEFGGVAHANRHLLENRDGAELLRQLGVKPATARRFAHALPDHHPAAVVGQQVSDVVFRRHIIDWAAARRTAAPTWIYDFAWRSRGQRRSQALPRHPSRVRCSRRRGYGAGSRTDAPQAPADRMHEAFVRFARDGNPGWPAHDDETRSVMVFDAESHQVSGGYESARALSVLLGVLEQGDLSVTIVTP